MCVFRFAGVCGYGYGVYLNRRDSITIDENGGRTVKCYKQTKQ